jgi:hypothetical protein
MNLTMLGAYAAAVPTRAEKAKTLADMLQERWTDQIGGVFIAVITGNM